MGCFLENRNAIDRKDAKNRCFEKYLPMAPHMIIMSAVVLLTVLLTGCTAGDMVQEKESGYKQIIREETEMIGDNEMGVSTIYLAGGCFWGMQKFFDQFDGVMKTEVGYANGPDKEPTYQQVCLSSGHAETVRIDYDPDKISLEELLGYYFMVIDPLSVNRQGNDTGIQYRTGIYYTDESQLPEIRAIYQAEEEKAGAKLAVELEPIKNFFPAEEYHQKYLDKNPGGYCHISDRYFHLES